jgi:hypothetical protein
LEGSELGAAVGEGNLGGERTRCRRWWSARCRGRGRCRVLRGCRARGTCVWRGCGAAWRSSRAPEGGGGGSHISREEGGGESWRYEGRVRRAAARVACGPLGRRPPGRRSRRRYGRGEAPAWQQPVALRGVGTALVARRLAQGGSLKAARSGHGGRDASSLSGAARTAWRRGC